MTAVLTACLIAAPSDCIDDRLTIADAQSPMGCMLMAQPAIARWAEDHPHRRIVHWTCRRDDDRRA